MNFFVSDIHGAATEYFRLKEFIGLKKNDNLYILGDVLDGNYLNPEANLEILDDIIANNNIHLILGDHEYWHVMYYMSYKGNSNEDMDYCETQLTQMEFTGKPLLKYFRNKLSAKEYRRYITFLTKCGMSDFIKIGDFSIYLVHSSPCLCQDTEIWQREVTEIPLVLDFDYSQYIDSDPDMGKFMAANKTLRVGKSIVIAGGSPVRNYFERDPKLLEMAVKDDLGIKKQKVIVKGKNTLINCGCAGNTIGKITDGWENDLACLFIDAAGFNTVYLSDY